MNRLVLCRERWFSVSSISKNRIYRQIKRLAEGLGKRIADLRVQIFDLTQAKCDLCSEEYIAKLHNASV